MWKPYSPTLLRCGNPISPHLQCAETLFPSFNKVGHLISPLLQGVETSSAQICKVWKLNPPHLQGVETLFPPHLECVETLFPHIYKVWKPYSPTSNLQCPETLFSTFTEGENRIPQLFQGVEPISPHIY